MQRKPNFRNLEVISTKALTPHLQRVIFGGEDLKDFPIGEEGAYVKVMLESSKEAIEESGIRPKMKSYTVAAFDSIKQELSLDFVVNMHEGPATTWAQNAKAGDKIVIAGPGPRKIYDFPETDYLLFCDLTSINAVRAYLNLAPKSATGKAIICVPSNDDIIELTTKSRIEIIFETKEQDDAYSNIFKNYSKLSDKTIIFAAGEFHKVKLLKDSIKESTQVNKDNIYISSYWKRGMDDASFRDEKRQNR